MSLGLVLELAQIEERCWERILETLEREGRTDRRKALLNTAATVIASQAHANTVTPLSGATVNTGPSPVELTGSGVQNPAALENVEALTVGRGAYTYSRTSGLAQTDYDTVVTADGPEAFFKLEETSQASPPIDALGTATGVWNEFFTNRDDYAEPIPIYGISSPKGHEFKSAGATDNTSGYAKYVLADALGSAGAQSFDALFMIDNSVVDGVYVIAYSGTDTTHWIRARGAGIEVFWDTVGSSSFFAYPTGFTYGAEHHLAWVVDGTTGTLYLDGVFLGSLTVDGAVNVASPWFSGMTGSTFVVTGSTPVGAFPNTGHLSRVAFYDYALTPDQVEAHAAAIDPRGDALIFTDSATSVKVHSPGFRSAADSLGTSDSVITTATRSTNDTLGTSDAVTSSRAPRLPRDTLATRDTRRNEIVNPSGEYGATGYGDGFPLSSNIGGGATPARITTDFRVGSACVELTRTAVAGSTQFWHAGPNDKIAVSRGDTLAVRASAKHPGSSGFTNNCVVWWFNSSDVSTSQTTVQSFSSVNGTTWYDFSGTAVAPAGAVYARISISAGFPSTTVPVIRIDGVMVERTTSVGTYFDGDSGGGAIWEGTAGASASDLPLTTVSVSHTYLAADTLGTSDAAALFGSYAAAADTLGTSDSAARAALSQPRTAIDALGTADGVPRTYGEYLQGLSRIVSYWPFNETSGTSAVDLVGGQTGTYQAGATLGQTSLVNDSGTSVTMNGGSTAYATLPFATTPSDFSLVFAANWQAGTVLIRDSTSALGTGTFIFSNAGTISCRYGGGQYNGAVTAASLQNQTLVWAIVIRSGLIEVWADGVKVINGNGIGGGGGPFSPWFVAQNGTNSGQMATAKFDEIGYFSRALTSAELAALTSAKNTGSVFVAQRVVNLPRTASDTVGTSDAATKVIPARTGTDSLVFTDAVTTKRFVRAADTVGTSDSASRTLQRSRTTADQLGGPTSYSYEVLKDNPALYWRFGDPSGTTATDSSGFGRTGTYGSGVTLGTTGSLTGDPDTAITLDNTANGWVTGTFDPYGTGRYKAFDGRAWRNDSTSDDMLFANATSNNSHPRLRVAAGTQDVVFQTGTTSSGTWTGAWPGNAQWVTWGLIWDNATHVAELVINGTSMGTVTLTSGMSSGGFAAGSGLGLGALAWGGALDEMAYYASALVAPPLTVVRLAEHAAAAGRAPGMRDVAIRASGGATTADTLGTSDSAARIAQGFARTASDTLATSDAAVAVRISPRTATDALVFTDAATRGALTRARTASDALIATDAATRPATSVARTTTDTLATSDAATRTALLLSRTASDSLGTSDAATRAAAVRARTATDSLVFTDAATRVATFPRTAADALGTTDAATRLAAFVRSGTDALGTSDAATRTSTFARAATDALGTSDAATRTSQVFRTATDALVFTDVASRGAATRARTSADSLGTSDAATRLASFSRTSADALVFTDAAVATGTRSRAATDSLGTSDSASRTVVLPRTATDTLGTSDAVSALRTRSSADTLGTSDSATRAAIFRTRTAADSLGTSDSATRIRIAPRTTSDTLVFTDAATRPAALQTRTGSDTLATSDAATRTSSRSRTSSDALIFTDAATRTTARPRTTSDAVVFTDAATRAALLRTRTAADSLGTSDAAVAARFPVAFTSDTLIFTDVATRAAVLRSRTSADTIGSSDSATRITLRTRTSSDTLGTTDSATRIVLRPRTSSDSLGTSDAAARLAATRIRTGSDTLGTSDAATPHAIVSRTATDSLGTSDAATRSSTRTRFTSDTLVFTDAATRTATFPRSSTDTLGTSDSAARTVAPSRSSFDALVFTDTATQSATFARVTFDALGTSDAVERFVLYPRLASDTLGTSDTVVYIPNGVRAAFDTLGTTDSIATAVAFYPTFAVYGRSAVEAAISGKTDKAHVFHGHPHVGPAWTGSATAAARVSGTANARTIIKGDTR